MEAQCSIVSAFPLLGIVSTLYTVARGLGNSMIIMGDRRLGHPRSCAVGQLAVSTEEEVASTCDVAMAVG